MVQEAGMELPRGCPITRVQKWLNSGRTAELVGFLRKRHEERFFDPIGPLRSAPQSHAGYRFSMMSLAVCWWRQSSATAKGCQLPAKRNGAGLLKIRKQEEVPIEYPQDRKA